ncbi:MAG: type IV pilin protein [Chromatiales bacterium]|nr:type IV pilin protein [Chromatiales bacterium]
MNLINRFRIQQGFTLTEILIAVAVVGVLATVALPTYQSYMLTVRRSDAHTALNMFAMAMERQYVRDNRYNVSSTVADVYQDTSDRGFYSLDFGTVTAVTYILHATPIGAQASDSGCGTITINHLGERTASGTLGDEACW